MNPLFRTSTFAALALLASAQAHAETITFKDHGKVIASYSLDDLKKKAATTNITVFEPQESKPVAFRGFVSTSLFTEIYGDTWKKAEEILFTCSDGYQPSIPRADFEANRSVFAFEKKGSPNFTVAKTLDHEKQVQLGPLYLIWDNLRNPRLRADGAAGWPFQVTTVDLIEFSEKFPKLAPAEDSAEGVKRGFTAYRKYCMECHALNGQGGGKAPELTAIVPHKPKADLAKWIDDPNAVHPGTRMPKLNPWIKGKERQSLIDDVIQYLSLMTTSKTS